MDSDDIDRALAGDRQAMAAVVAELRREIHGEVARVLRYATAAEGRDPRDEVLDLVQSVFGRLFDDDAKLLRQWEPERGAAFIRVIARRHAIGVLRSKRRSPYTNVPVSGETIDQRSSAGEPDRDLEGRAWVDQVLDRLADELDETGQSMFSMLYVEERSIEEVCEQTGKTRDAVYAWRLRFKKRVERLISELSPT